MRRYTKKRKTIKGRNKRSRHRYRHTRNKRGGALDESAKNVVAKSIQNKSQALTNILQTYCSNPDNCLTLGHYGDYIKQFFDNFRNLSYVDNNALKRIGNTSANGLILQLPFKKDGYTAYTALKCSVNQTSDNLFYEYYVGKYFVNTYIKKFPLFLETYDCYEFYNVNMWQQLINFCNNKSFPPNFNIQNFVRRVNVDENDMSMFEESCVKNKLFCILIQYFDKFYDFEKKFLKEYDSIKYDIFNLLYQIYFVLCSLNDKYTHYDLHSGNVFLYKPYDGYKCILMRYHRNNVVYEFKSEYIVKVIDYGRNFFDNGKVKSGDIIHNYICGKPKCEPDCGYDYGYASIASNTQNPEDFYWINPEVPNRSHDIRMFVKDYMEDFFYDNLKIKIQYDEDYGTPEDMTDIPKTFNNIFSVRKFLESYIPAYNLDKNKKKYGNWTVAATMDIYDDGREYDFKVV